MIYKIDYFRRLASKRVNENQHLNTNKISRSTISTPLSSSLTTLVSDEPVNPRDLDYTPVIIPDFFAEQNGNGTETEFAESVLTLLFITAFLSSISLLQQKHAISSNSSNLSHTNLSKLYLICYVSYME